MNKESNLLPLNIEDENVFCPICNKQIFNMIEFHPCEHLVCCYPWNGDGGFEIVTKKIESWWKKLIDGSNPPDPMTLSKCPYLEFLIIHTQTGVNCGPVKSIVSFGFSKAKEKSKC